MSNANRSLIYWAAVFLALAGAVFTLPPGAVWITDNGNKYIMMRNFARGEGIKIAHPFPALFPTGGFHFIKEHDGVRSFYPEFLSFFTTPFYKIFGERGILFFPLAATLLLLFMAWRYWHVPPPLLLLSTPLFFYSLVLWEMTPAVFLVTAVLLLASRERFFAAGMVLGASLLMREEAYFVCAALGAALLFCGRRKAMLKLGAGFLLPAAGLWFYQWSIHGHFLGKHGQYYYLNNNGAFSVTSQLKAAFFNYFHHLLRFDGWGKHPMNYLVLSILPLLAAGAAPGFRRWHIFKLGAGVFYLISMILLASGAWFQKNTVYASSMLTGALTATPVMAGFFLNWRSFLRCRRFRIFALFALLYLAGVPPLMTASDVGLIWGARHFLFLMPLLVYLSYCGFRFMGIPRIRKGSFRWRQLLPAGAVVLSAAIQLYGFAALRQVSGECRSIEHAILSRPEKVIVTDVFYLPEQMPRLFFEKTVLQVITHEDLVLLEKFWGKGSRREFLLILSPQFRRMNDDVLKKLLAVFPLTAPPERVTAKGGFPDLFIGRSLRK